MVLFGLLARLSGFVGRILGISMASGSIRCCPFLLIVTRDNSLGKLKLNGSILKLCH